MWRAWIVGDRRPERIEFAGPNAFAPATAASLNRLAFGHGRGADAIYRFEKGHPPEALLESSLLDSTPHLSPDGRRVTFESQSEDGTWDIWTIDAEGGSPRRLTLDPGNENMPSWSRDGHWIYFQSDRRGAQEIWRIPATGGSEERVTHGGGNSAYESADGKTLFFTRTLNANASLFALPLAGGPERKVLDCLSRFGFAVGPGGIYHLGCTADLRAVPLYLLDPATGQDRFLGKLENAVFGLTVSPDGKTILYTKRETQGSDLMMIENFR
jgi:Tol biopolymer transport system component